MKKHIYTFWGGPRPPIIDYCLFTIKERAGVPVTLLTPENVDEYLAGALHSNYKALTNIAQKVDCIRIGILYNHADATKLCVPAAERKLVLLCHCSSERKRALECVWPCVADVNVESRLIRLCCII